MTAATSPTQAEPISPGERASRRSQMRLLLLGCGVLSGALYFVNDAVMAAVYPGYSYLHQAVSELNAFGAPTWGLSVAFGLAGYLLLVPFAAGIWNSAAVNSALRVSAGALAIMGITSLWPFRSARCSRVAPSNPLRTLSQGCWGCCCLRPRLDVRQQHRARDSGCTPSPPS
jgi:hypothetical protein